MDRYAISSYVAPLAAALLILAGAAASPARADPPPLTVFFGTPAPCAVSSQTPVAPVILPAAAPEIAPEIASVAASAEVRPRAPSQPMIEAHLRRTFPGGRVERAELRIFEGEGGARRSNVVALSVLARPADAPPPELEEVRLAERGADRIGESIPLVHPELVARLEALAARFPGREIEIVLGTEPSFPASSRHHHARALDLQVDGVEPEALAAVLRELPQTGVGRSLSEPYVHLDVRARRLSWIERDAGAEGPRFVRDPDQPAEPSAGEEAGEEGDEGRGGGEDLDALRAQIRSTFDEFDQRMGAGP